MYIFLLSRRLSASTKSDSPSFPTIVFELGLDTVYAFLLTNPLATFARLGTIFAVLSPSAVASRYEILLALSDAKNSSFDPNETCKVGTSRVLWALGGK